MTDALMKAHVSEKSGNLVTCKMRMMYASLFTSVPPSKSVKDPKRFQWGLTGLIPAGADIDAINAEIERVADENMTPAQRKNTKWKNPLLKTADISSLAQYADDYPYCIRPNAKEFTRDGRPRPRPDVVDAKGKEVKAEDEADDCYNGRWFRCSLNPYWYPANDGQPGISLGLVNVQLLGHADPLAGGKVSADKDFEAVDGELDDLEDDMAGLE